MPPDCYVFWENLCFCIYYSLSRHRCCAFFNEHCEDGNKYICEIYACLNLPVPMPISLLTLETWKTDTTNPIMGIFGAPLVHCSGSHKKPRLKKEKTGFCDYEAIKNQDLISQMRSHTRKGHPTVPPTHWQPRIQKSESSVELPWPTSAHLLPFCSVSENSLTWPLS